LKEDLSKAIGLLFDIVFNSTFPEEEFTKEKM
jgi:predicted Zn-dependent peptidase